ncbi:Aldose 1-epimerase [Quillaja saponaria]|uniref:Aldose 1-epimerase n=1 Tax=Quillaja saponaria TaxID=32244 RepID=A0AAD7KUC0_QUISA|nr:Aldose 1-epimerase [Quillaja saponaria]
MRIEKAFLGFFLSLWHTGEFEPVKDTPYDFLQPHEIGSLIHKLQNGYDINFVLDTTTDKHFKKVTMLKNEIRKGGAVHKKHAGLCLETQGFPDSVNHPNFPSQVVNPGETSEHVMVYRFTAS